MVSLKGPMSYMKMLQEDNRVVLQKVILIQKQETTSLPVGFPQRRFLRRTLKIQNILLLHFQDFHTFKQKKKTGIYTFEAKKFSVYQDNIVLD